LTFHGIPAQIVTNSGMGASVILFVCKDKSKITDFIMWADVEFAMQLEIMEMGKFEDQSVTIIDLREAGELGGIGSGETLYVLCHGSLNSPNTSLQGEKYSWFVLGAFIGGKLGMNCGKIVLFACYAASGTIGSRPIDLFIKGLQSKKREGIVVVGYQGATVTTTFNTIAARDEGANMSDSILTLDGNTNWRDKQKELVINYFPQKQFDSYLDTFTNATTREKAINAARITEKFYYAYGSEMQKNNRFYAVGIGMGLAVTLTS
jgi:hypothetical protein